MLNNLQMLIDKNYDNISCLCKKHDVAKLWAFGSVCTDKFSDKSDIDLLISFNNISIEKYTDNYFILHERFENIFQRPVDLLTVKMLSNPYLIKVMDKTKTLIYG